MKRKLYIALSEKHPLGISLEISAQKAKKTFTSIGVWPDCIVEIDLDTYLIETPHPHGLLCLVTSHMTGKETNNTCILSSGTTYQFHIPDDKTPGVKTYLKEDLQ